MEITGWDSVVFTFTPPHEVFVRVLAFVLGRWPAALVDGLGGPESRPEPVAGFSAERLPTGAGHLLFYRDEAMARHMDEAAYVPMADGDGPFAVIARVRRDVEFAMSALDELGVTDETLRVGLPLDPYQAWLCTPLLFEITAVTPGDPTRQPFSSWVLGEIKRACRHAHLSCDHLRPAR
jgi:hypothetical protein